MKSYLKFLTITEVLLTSVLYCQPQLSLSEQLAYSTLRVSVTGQNFSALGTGFIFSFLADSLGDIPCIVTNKHVVKQTITGSFVFTSADPDGSPNPKVLIPVTLDSFESRWIGHPDSNVDLAIMPIAPVLNAAISKKQIPFYRKFNKTNIPSARELSELTAVEDILMIGYPVGLYDVANNYPIFRKGITATHISNNYLGKDQFLIDAACYHGSSGSPVVLLNQGSYSPKSGGLVAGTRFYFLGILYAGPEFTANGEIKIVNIPHRQDLITQTKIPMNLGVVIKSSKLLDFEPILTKLIGDSK